jgi:hypothetical protein
MMPAFYNRLHNAVAPYQPFQCVAAIFVVAVAGTVACGSLVYNTAAADNTRTFALYDASAPCQQSDQGRRELLVALHCGYGSSHEALRQTESTARGGKLRHSGFSLSLVPRGGSPASESLLRLRHLGCRQTASPQPALEVLFCTWQT